MTGRVVAVLVLLLVFGLGVVGPVSAAVGAGPSPAAAPADAADERPPAAAVQPAPTRLANDTSTTPPEELTLDELKKGGTRPQNAPPSVRAADTYREYAVKYLPTGLWVIEGEDSPFWRYLARGTTVKRNSVQLWSKRGYGLDPVNVTVRIAYYQRDSELVEEDNATRRVPIATNISTHAIDATLTGGYDYVEVDLDPHYEEAVWVTMCVEPADSASNCLLEPTDQRWTFEHHSAKSARHVPRRSEGQRLAWGLLVLLLPTLASSASTLYIGRSLLERADAGPKIPLWIYPLAALGVLIILGVFWDQLSSVLITAPWVASLLVGLLLGLLALIWYGDNTYRALALRLRLWDVDDPGPPEEIRDELRAQFDDDEDIYGALWSDVVPLEMARNPETGARSVVKRGLAKFIARARGAKAEFETDQPMETKIPVRKGPYDEIYLLDPEADEPLEYRAERHEFEFPTIIEYGEDEDGNRQFEGVNLAPLVLGGAALWGANLFGKLLFDSAALGLLLGGVLLIGWKVWTPKQGRFLARLAPIQYNHVLGTMLMHAQKLGDAKNWQRMYTRMIEQETEHQLEEKELDDAGTRSQFRTVTDRYLGNGQDDRDGRRDDGGGDDQEVTIDDE